MKILIKSLILASLVLFTQAHLSEQLQVKGRQLGFLRNLPHRYLGMLYYSWLLQPHRTDFLCEYAISWHIASSLNERFSIYEATTKPTVPLLVISESLKHPESERLQRLSKFLLAEEKKKRTISFAISVAD